MYTRADLNNPRKEIKIKTPLNKTFLQTCAASLLSALAIVILFFAIGGFAPFGNRSLTYNDGESQVLDLLCWFKDVLSGKSFCNFCYFYN